MGNVLEFLTYFRDTPPSSSRVPKKSLVAALRAVSTGLRQLSRHVLLRSCRSEVQIQEVNPKADLSACRRKHRRSSQILEAFNERPTHPNMRRFYGYLSAYLSSIYGHRTGVLTNMKVAELDEAREDAKSGTSGFVINVKDHKTNKSFGPAQLYLTMGEFAWLELWSELRGKLNPSTDLLLFNENGQKINNMQQHLQNAWRRWASGFPPSRTSGPLWPPM
ncbi:uncharacterized protein LOC122845270 [Gambusia affinis]|uniref:uncharacterized protein LOC122845270 n=1 Tax=Gambusia affinis TaxID=33528 RepID=UPI001CDCFDF6|nr:uncharacterized protein LOC122845270 [Gambusia affinis]